MILEEAPQADAGLRQSEERPSRAPHAARSPSRSRPKPSRRWREAAERLAAHLKDNPELDLTDVAYSLATTRAAFEHRAVALGADREELLGVARRLSPKASPSPSARKAPRQATASSPTSSPARAPSALGMGKELYESDPAFARRLRASLRGARPTPRDAP